MSIFDNKTVLVTGGTGSFGQAFVRTLLAETQVKRLTILSRDEFKQYEMGQGFKDETRIRFFLGDVRDLLRLRRAFQGVDYIVHAAALKHIPATEYNPFEAVKTNINGAQNVIEAAIDAGVQKVIALSTDKASSPANLYGATKLVGDKLFVDGNAYAAHTQTRFSVVRYGNVMGSRGSVIPFFKKLATEKAATVPITHPGMTRFWITLDQGVRFVISCFEQMQGGEIYVPKIPSMKLTDLAEAICPGIQHEIIGIRPGEKLHEQMISTDDARQTIDAEDRYIIQPDVEWWYHRAQSTANLVPEGFHYRSDVNDQWLSVEQLRQMVGIA